MRLKKFEDGGQTAELDFTKKSETDKKLVQAAAKKEFSIDEVMSQFPDLGAAVDKILADPQYKDKKVLDMGTVSRIIHEYNLVKKIAVNDNEYINLHPQLVLAVAVILDNENFMIKSDVVETIKKNFEKVQTSSPATAEKYGTWIDKYYNNE